MRKILFFCLLFTAFLNTSSRAQDAADYKFIPPLVLSDYNDESTINNLGGISGGDAELPGTAYATIVSDNGFRRGESGSALRIDYDVPLPGDYSFYWIKMGKELYGKPGVTATFDMGLYNYLSFWIKGDPDIKNIKVEVHQDIDDNGIFVFGKDITAFAYTDSYMNGVVDKGWKKVVIPLADFAVIKDWSKIIEIVFVFENKNGTPKGTLYLDDMIFGYRPALVLISKGIKEITAPMESSFKVNGVSSKQCPTFKGSNALVINTESVYDNPYIESFRFEYSVDKANTWRTIRTDYDVSKKTHNLSWLPDNSRELMRCQVRAVASDIWGNDKATRVLIDCPVQPITDDEFLDMIEKKAFDFFLDHQSLGTGLFSDTTGGGDASIASTGFGIAALCIGAQRGWISKYDAQKRTILALDAFLPRGGSEESMASGRYGFFYHFLDINTGKRAGKSEISTVDTAILLCGAIMAGEYFGGDIKEKANKICERVEWDKFLCRDKGPFLNIFSMGWSPERGMLESYWDYYTDEVIIINLLAIGSPTHPVPPDAFYAWVRNKGSYGGGKEFIYTWHGALFSYQYANAWFDFRGLADKKGVNWFDNSTNATLANRQFCIDNADKFKGYGPNSWGITSMARPEAYTMHFGVPPTGNGEPEYDGTLSPTGPSGSIIFTPYLSLSALKYMYINYPRLWGQYGMKDSFDVDKNWYSTTYYGIGEAMLLLPIENFRTGFVWKYFMKSPFIQDALNRVGFTKVKPFDKGSGFHPEPSRRMKKRR